LVNINRTPTESQPIGLVFLSLITYDFGDFTEGEGYFLSLIQYDFADFTEVAVIYISDLV